MIFKLGCYFRQYFDYHFILLYDDPIIDIMKNKCICHFESADDVRFGSFKKFLEKHYTHTVICAIEEYKKEHKLKKYFWFVKVQKVTVQTYPIYMYFIFSKKSEIKEFHNLDQVKEIMEK